MSEKIFPRAVYAQIDVHAIAQNYLRIKKHVAGPKVCAVIKAGAYGHGAVPVAKALCAVGVDYLAVAIIEEACELRDAGITAPILVFGYVDPANAALAIAYRLTLSVYEPSLAQALSAAALQAGTEATIHIKIDTGMNRLGLKPEQAQNFAHLLRRLPGLTVEGIYSHFSDADIPGSSFAQEQYAEFLAAVAVFSREGINPSIRHIAASGGILNMPESWLDMVRPGIILYGLSALGTGKTLDGLSTAMRLCAHICMIKTVRAGQSVSYGRSFFAQKDMRIATLPIGYADGYFRNLSGRCSVSLHGMPVPQIGRICMDQCMIDVSDIPDVKEGDSVTLFGDNIVPVRALANILDTIDYEIVCAVKHRVPRLYGENHQ